MGFQCSSSVVVLLCASVISYVASVMSFPVSILHKSIVGRYRPVRVADGPITALYRFTKNASWVICSSPLLPSVPREGRASRLWLSPGIWHHSSACFEATQESLVFGDAYCEKGS